VRVASWHLENCSASARAPTPNGDQVYKPSTEAPVSTPRPAARTIAFTQFGPVLARDCGHNLRSAPRTPRRPARPHRAPNRLHRLSNLPGPARTSAVARRPARGEPGAGPSAPQAAGRRTCSADGKDSFRLGDRRVRKSVSRPPAGSSPTPTPASRSSDSRAGCPRMPAPTSPRSTSMNLGGSGCVPPSMRSTSGWSWVCGPLATPYSSSRPVCRGARSGSSPRSP
jgi:hypothetical protein